MAKRSWRSDKYHSPFSITLTTVSPYRFAIRPITAALPWRIAYYGVENTVFLLSRSLPAHISVKMALLLVSLLLPTTARSFASSATLINASVYFLFLVPLAAAPFCTSRCIAQC